MRESQHDNLDWSVDQKQRDRVVRREKKEKKSKDRKAKTKNRYSLGKKKVHPITAMANGSEATLSPTIDHKTKGSADMQKKTDSSAPVHSHEEAPGMRLTSGESSEGDKEESASDVDIENNALVAPESSYTSDSDPYVYSDDSESLSDAYFRPSFSDYPAVLYPRSTSHGSVTSTLTAGDNHIGGRVPSSEVDPLAPFQPHPYHQSPQLGYGTLPIPERTPFKKISSIVSILEDSPVDEEQQLLHGDPSLLHQNYSYPSPAAAAEMDAQYLKQNKKERRRNRKQQKAATRQRQMQMIQNQQRQKEQVDRERTVAEVKGRPQDETKYRDSIYAYLFVIQLLIVLCLAFNSASTVMFAKEAPTWGTLKHTTTDGKSSTSQTTATTSTTTTTATQNQGTRHLLDHIFQEADHYRGHLRRLHNGNLVTKPVNTSSPTQDLLVNDDDSPDNTIRTSSTLSKEEHPEAQPMISTQSKSTASTEELGEPTSFTIDYRNAIQLIGVSGLYASVLSYLSFGFMLIMSRALIQVTLVFSILLALAWGMIGLTIDPYGIVSVMGFGALLLTLGYTIYNWQRIPFASTNLHTALCAMRCTSDITILGMVAILVSFTWCILWSMAFIGSVDKYDPGKCTDQRLCVFEVPMVEIGLYGFFIISFYWTNTVIKNILRVTVASTIGTWWYYPQEISPFCSPAVGQPLLRSLTKSLGSICLGSLLSQAVQFSYAAGRCFCCMSNCRRHAVQSICDGENEDSQEIDTADLTEDESSDASASLVTEKKLAPSLKKKKKSGSSTTVGNQIRCYNRWAYSYIGLYGYGFTEGGEKAMQLFEAREWTEVVRDNLIQDVLMMASIVIGGSTGSFAVLAEEVDGFLFTTLHRPITTAFLIGSVLGFVLSNVLLLGVVGSAVNTVLVCFAAGPFEFNKNHPRLSREMIDVWGQQVWEPSA